MVGPVVKRVFPADGSRQDFGFAAIGCHDSTEDIVAGKTDSDGYRLIASEAPAELSMLLNRKDLSLRQASTLLHAILRAQNRYTPEFVGPPYNLVWLSKDGALLQIKYSD